MKKIDLQMSRIAGLAIILGLGGWVQAALAVDINFENPPYTAGSIIGQEGWVTNAYITAPVFGGSPNGDVNVSASAPLAGSQSLLYNQTSVKGAPSLRPGASDVSKANVTSIVADGTARADLRASMLLQTDTNNLNDPAFPAADDGAMGFYLSRTGTAATGASPVAVLVRNANSVNGTGEITVPVQTPPQDFESFGAYTANNIIELTVNVNFDSTPVPSYEVFVRDVTAGGPVTQLVGPAGPVSPAFRFYNTDASFPPDAVGGNVYTVDVGYFLRGGIGRIDQFTLTQIPEPMTLGMALLGFAAVILLRRGRR